jgi:Uma2 family endonuclease
MSAIQLLPRYNYDDYVQWEGKWEVIRGIPYAMAPAPIPKHQYLATNIASEFRHSLKKCKKCKVYQPLDYKVDNETILQPDVLILCHEIKKKFLDFPPTLVVEILSPATELKDRHTKFEIYQEQGIPYYLIVSPESETVELYELENERYVPRKNAHDFTYTFLLENCEAIIYFDEIW